MHWVDRGPEPVGLEPLRSRYTPRWVDHYRNRVGERPPSDSRWRDFHQDLREVFAGICAYCEEADKGEIDHFRPKSRFPELTYEWSNWLFACHNCNSAKREKWPAGGYVNPCASSIPARPENFFDFDTVACTIIPRAGLSRARREKATRTIQDLQLNAPHHLQWRQTLLVAIAKVLSEDPSLNAATIGFLNDYSGRTSPLSSIVRAFLAEQGIALNP